MLELMNEREHTKIEWKNEICKCITVEVEIKVNNSQVIMIGLLSRMDVLVLRRLKVKIERRVQHLFELRVRSRIYIHMVRGIIHTVLPLILPNDAASHSIFIFFHKIYPIDRLSSVVQIIIIIIIIVVVIALGLLLYNCPKANGVWPIIFVDS